MLVLGACLDWLFAGFGGFDVPVGEVGLVL